MTLAILIGLLIVASIVIYQEAFPANSSKSATSSSSSSFSAVKSRTNSQTINRTRQATGSTAQTTISANCYRLVECLPQTAGLFISILKGASTNHSSSTFSLPPAVTLATGVNQSTIQYGPNGFSLNVFWTNNDTVPHELDIYSGGGACASPRLLANSGEISPNKTFSYTFGLLGTYSYKDVNYSWMTGSLSIVYANHTAYRGCIPQCPNYLCLQAGSINMDILKGASTNRSSTGFSLSSIIKTVGDGSPSISVPMGFSLNTTWTNHDAVIHGLIIFSNGTSCGGPRLIGTSGAIYPNQSFSFAFQYPGTYTYLDPSYPWMKGTLTIVGGPNIASNGC